MPKSIPTPAKEVNPELKFHLEQGKVSVRELVRLTGRSESRTRELLKEFGDAVSSEKQGATTFFWIANPGQEPEASSQEVVKQENEVLEAKTDEVPASEGACPLCGSNAQQDVAGADEYLAAARVCSDCGRTWNIHSREEIVIPAEAIKPKRKPLNPQYKINEKVEQVKAAGGKLVYQKEARTWVLTAKGKDPKRMTAKEFSVETPESLIDYIEAK